MWTAAERREYLNSHRDPAAEGEITNVLTQPSGYASFPRTQISAKVAKRPDITFIGPDRPK